MQKTRFKVTWNGWEGTFIAPTLAFNPKDLTPKNIKELKFETARLSIEPDEPNMVRIAFLTPENPVEVLDWVDWDMEIDPANDDVAFTMVGPVDKADNFYKPISGVLQPQPPKTSSELANGMFLAYYKFMTEGIQLAEPNVDNMERITNMIDQLAKMSAVGSVGETLQCLSDLLEQEE